MLSSASLLVTPDLLVRDLQCAHPRGGWGGVELARRAAIVFPRRGSFRRRGLHGEEVVEPGVAYFQRPGEEEEFAHPHDGDDRCTCVAISEDVLASLLGGDPLLPARARPAPRAGGRPRGRPPRAPPPGRPGLRGGAPLRLAARLLYARRLARRRLPAR